MKNSRTNIVIFRIKSICEYKNKNIELLSYQVRAKAPIVFVV